jgi:hypothetical protein
MTARPRFPASRRAVLAFVAAVVVLNVGFSVGMDRLFPTVRDPEYGRRLSRLQARQAENPGRPFVVALGSSRAAFALKPTAANAETGPLAYNFALLGSGPMMQLMALRRLLYDGVTPAAVVLEYWPPFLREDGQFAEEARIDKHRLLTHDAAFVRDYFDLHEHTLATMRQVRQNPWFEHRLRVLSQTIPNWVTPDRRLDGPWQRLDPWGWMNSFEAEPTAAERAERHRMAKQYFDQVFDGYAVHEKAARAVREVLALCRERGIPVALAWLPESSEFRAWYPPDALAKGERFLKELRAEYGVPVIDARRWVDDPLVADGFHLTRAGADQFSRRFGDEMRKLGLGEPTPQAAPLSPSPLGGEGRGGGWARPTANAMLTATGQVTPLPNPPPQGGREQSQERRGPR